LQKQRKHKINNICLADKRKKKRPTDWWMDTTRYDQKAWKLKSEEKSFLKIKVITQKNNEFSNL